MVGLDETKFVSGAALQQMGEPDVIDELYWFETWKDVRLVNGLKMPWDGCLTCKWMIAIDYCGGKSCT